ncbi:MAG TPA: hypothetical protein VF624_05340 [Tepidisphaeraceae bacterium]|jgi:hypothetical protein
MTEATTQPAQQVSEAVSSLGAAAKAIAVLRQGIAQTDLLAECRNMHAGVAVVLIFAGVIFLLWGYYAFKGLVTLNAAVLGAWLGAMIGGRNDALIPAALIGMFLAAVVTWPLMKWAVAVMGGIIGMTIGMSLWRAFGIDPNFAAAGGGMGLIFFGMLSFILFRSSVMMFTSLQGSMMLIAGILGVIYKIGSIDGSVIDTKLTLSPLIMPMVIGFATVCGIIYQNAQGATEAPPAK